jgi:hypothetical protein
MSILRDISVIILAAGAFVFTLIPLALFGAVVYGVWWLLRHRNLPTWLRRGREYLTIGLSYVGLAMDAVTKPIFAVHTAFATVGGWIRGLTKRGGE